MKKAALLKEYGIQLQDSKCNIFEDMLTFGESFVDGKWDTQDLEDTFYRVLTARELAWKRRMFSKEGQPGHTENNAVIDAHYDLPVEVFEAMLGASWSYSCADYSLGAPSLDLAQQTKHRRVARKLELTCEMTVLDLGCGFGGLARQLKLDYPGITVVGYTLSPNQAEVARQFCDEVHVKDYREAEGRFDRVVSMGLLEHVGADNYRDYFKTVHGCLNKDGISLFQVICQNTSHRTNNPWINKYIFPGGMLPSVSQLAQACERLFVVEDLENLGPSYAQTCRAWWENFREGFKNHKFDVTEQFYRMWYFYLMISAASFRARQLQLYQCVISKGREQQPRRL